MSMPIAIMSRGPIQFSLGNFAECIELTGRGLALHDPEQGRAHDPDDEDEERDDITQYWKTDAGLTYRHNFNRIYTAARGLFGPNEGAHPELPYHIGDLIPVARGESCFWRVDTPSDIRRYRGIHSGVTADEMLVPLLAVRLDAL